MLTQEPTKQTMVQNKVQKYNHKFYFHIQIFYFQLFYLFIYLFERKREREREREMRGAEEDRERILSGLPAKPGDHHWARFHKPGIMLT